MGVIVEILEMHRKRTGIRPRPRVHLACLISCVETGIRVRNLKLAQKNLYSDRGHRHVPFSSFEVIFQLWRCSFAAVLHYVSE